MTNRHKFQKSLQTQGTDEHYWIYLCSTKILNGREETRFKLLGHSIPAVAVYLETNGFTPQEVADLTRGFPLQAPEGTYKITASTRPRDL